MEPNREPGEPDPGSPQHLQRIGNRSLVGELLRPMWLSVALGLDLLFGEHLLEHVRNGRWTHCGGSGYKAAAPSAQPVIAYGRPFKAKPSQHWLIAQAEGAMLHGLRQRYGIEPVTRGSLGNGLRGAIGDPDPDETLERREHVVAILAELRQQVHDTGIPLTSAKIAEVFVAADLELEDVPEELRAMAEEGDAVGRRSP